MQILENKISVDLFYDLYKSVGWIPPSNEQIEMALKHSTANFLVYDGVIPVAMARIIGDLGMSFYLKDFVVIPSMQRKGIGSSLLEHIENYILKIIQPNWAVSFELMSSRGMESFYKKNGFEQRPSQWDGSGMFKMIGDFK